MAFLCYVCCLERNNVFFWGGGENNFYIRTINQLNNIMKKLYAFLSVLLIISLVSGCKKDDEKGYGGFQFKYIYVLDSGVLKDGQNYTVVFPAVGGSQALKIVSFAELELSGPKEGDGFKAEVADDETLYDKVTFNGYSNVSRYVQTVNISAEANSSASKKEFDILVVSYFGDGHAAYFHITQNGK